METHGWGAPEIEGSPIPDETLERQRQKNLLVLFVLRDHEREFTEDLLVDESGAADPNLPVLARVSSLMEVLPIVGIYEFVATSWSQVMLMDSRVNFKVAWLRDEVVVSSWNYQ